MAAGASQIAGGVSIIGEAGIGPALLATSWIPIVGAVAAVAALILHFVGGGCGMACISAAEAEQVYEAAAENLLAVLKLGMIPRSAAIAGMQAFIQGGVQHEAQLASASGAETPQARAGSANLTKVINILIGQAGSYPDTMSTPLNLAAAQNAFIAPGTHGWYASSLAAATQLAMTFLQQIAASLPPVAPTPSGVSPGPGTPVPATGGGIFAPVARVATQAGTAIEQAVGIAPTQVSPLIVLVVVGVGAWALFSMEK